MLKSRRLIVIPFLVLFAAQCVTEEPIRDDITVQEMTSPVADGSRYPYLHHSSESTAMSWLQKLDSTHFAVQVASLTNGVWSDPETVVESDSFFVNWADFPSVVSYDGKPIAAHWLQKVPGGTYAYHVMMSFRNEDGSWSQPFSPHRDGTPTEHGFVSMIALDADRVLAVWLDGRNTGGGGHDDHGGHAADNHGASDLDNAMTLRSAEINRDGSIEHEHEIDSAICDCCQTSLVDIPGGALVVYRDRSSEEIRDIYKSRYSNSTNSWDTPITLHNDGWQINGCPVNGPRVIANGMDVVAVWFTMAGETPQVKASRSNDGGLSFSDPVIVDEGRTNGRVDVVFDGAQTAWISWMGSDGENPKLAMRSWPKDKELGDIRFVGDSDDRRGSGFPRMVWAGDRIVMATTQTADAMVVKVREIEIK